MRSASNVDPPGGSANRRSRITGSSPVQRNIAAGDTLNQAKAHMLNSVILVLMIIEIMLILSWNKWYYQNGIVVMRIVMPLSTPDPALSYSSTSASAKG